MGVFLPDLVRYIISFFNHFVAPVFKTAAANAAMRWILANSPWFAVFNSTGIPSQRGDLVKIHLIAQMSTTNYIYGKFLLFKCKVFKNHHHH